VTNDFVFSKGGKNVKLLANDIQDWNITFVDTGLISNIGQRLKVVQKHLKGEEIFLANYSDCLSDVRLPKVIQSFKPGRNVACFVSVKPRASFHLINTDSKGVVKSIENIGRSSARINGGFFALRHEIFDYLHEGEDLVEKPFERLINEGKLMAYPHEGYWACMDTFKEKQDLEDMFSRGNAPWAVWNHQH
jgi:glucose-1-phosphate cytidylyltransferase